MLKSYPNLDYVIGQAKFKSKDTLIITTADGEREESFDRIIIATGSYPQMTETQGVDLPNVMTSDDLLAMDRIPESMIVVGGGVIGLEFASIYQNSAAKSRCWHRVFLKMPTWKSAKDCLLSSRKPA